MHFLNKFYLSKQEMILVWISLQDSHHKQMNHQREKLQKKSIFHAGIKKQKQYGLKLKFEVIAVKVFKRSSYLSQVSSALHRYVKYVWLLGGRFLCLMIDLTGGFELMHRSAWCQTPHYAATEIQIRLAVPIHTNSKEPSS